MALTRWTRYALALAVLGARADVIAQADPTKWQVPCTGGTLTVKVNDTNPHSLLGDCAGGISFTKATNFVATNGVKLVVNNVTSALTVIFGSIGTLESL